MAASRAKLTPKQRVLKRYPKAFAYEWAGPTWCIYSPWHGGNEALSLSSPTAAQAWAEAWGRLKRGGQPWG